jgi:RNA polymerase, sigma 28 subunit, SigD/FliA/WhiG
MSSRRKVLEKFKHKDEKELWQEYRKTKNSEIREYFVIKYSPLVKYVAGKVAIGMPQQVEFEDLVSYGAFCLKNAIEKYDPERHLLLKPMPSLNSRILF